MYKVALTGGIASGKSTVSDLFAALGVDIIDTDVISREVVQPGTPALDEIRTRFGDQVINDNGALNRTRLREHVFADPAKRGQLEAILHPRIERLMLQRAAASSSAYCMLVIPLLVETGQQKWADRVLVVDIPASLQRDRLQQRDKLSPEQIEKMLAAQASREERLAIADDVIRNSNSKDDLCAQVEHLHQQYLRLASAADGGGSA